jgi:predicted nucleotide-binding protein (sugar kinase/HSP70/actin superfamily)
MDPSPFDESRTREGDVARRCAEARERLERRAGLAGGSAEHFRRPVERPFTASERHRVTVLFGGLTSKHDRLLRAVFESCGHRSVALPEPDRAACHVGKQYCDNGVCNPAYFTIGNLILYLQRLEASGLSRSDIIDQYVFFTAGSGGPCRFGMYEAQYRLALRNAGFEGFRVLLFVQDHGVRADTGQPGLRLSLAFALGVVNAIVFADALQAFGYEVRPFERTPGLTDRRLAQSLEQVAASLAAGRPARPPESLPAWVRCLVWPTRRDALLAIYDHLYGPLTTGAIRACRAPLDDVEVDRLRVKPVVKVTGEFWAQTTEGDGNFKMFSFLEREGAHVLVEPVGGWILYLLQYVRARTFLRRRLDVSHTDPWPRRLFASLRGDRRVAGRWLLVELAEQMYKRHYDRIRRTLGIPHPLPDQRELARLADPHYRQLARGGEGHLEVAKNIYYTTRRAAHMVLSLKPFGCLPSTQSDGVQAKLQARMQDALFLAIETGVDGELAAHGRVQLALVEAQLRAQAEFERALAATGRRLDDIRQYVDEHPEMRRASYLVPRRAGVAGLAANFVLHVADRMRKGGRSYRPKVAAPAASGGA